MRWRVPAAAILLAVLWPVRSVQAQDGPDNDPDGAPGYTNSFFHHSSVDSINLYNGQLTVPIPIGPSYPVGPKLKFQAMLTYNSRTTDYGHPTLGYQSPDYTYTPMVGNLALGLGWDFTLGAIKLCQEGSASGFCFVAPDGSQRLFSQAVGGGFYKTADGSQGYLQDLGSGGPFQMWDADGNLYAFNQNVSGFDDTAAGAGYVRDFGRGRNGWYVTSVTNPFGNGFSVNYWSNTSPCWTYDPLSPCTSTLTRMVCPVLANTWIPQTITLPTGTISVLLSGNQIWKFQFPVVVNGTQTTKDWTLVYQTEGFAKICEQLTVLTVNAREIAAIQLPSDLPGSPSYTFTYSCGLLSKMVLPSSAEIRYLYGTYSFYHGRYGAMEPGCLPSIPKSFAVIEISSANGCGSQGQGAAPMPNIPGGCSDTNDIRWLDHQTGVIKRTENVPGLSSALTDYTQYAFPFGEQGSPSFNLGPQTLTVVLFPEDVDHRRRAKAVLFWAGPHGTLNHQPGDRTGADIEERVFDSDPNTNQAISMPACGGTPSQAFCPNNAVRVTQRVYEYDNSGSEVGNRRMTSETALYGPTQSNGSCLSCPYHRVAFLPTGSSATWEADGRHYESETHSGILTNDYRQITTTWAAQTSPRYLPNLFTHRTESNNGPINLDRYFEFDTSTGFLKGSFIYDSGRLRVFLSCWYNLLGQGNPDQEFTATYSNSWPGYPGPPPNNVCSAYYPSIPTIAPNSDFFAQASTFQNGQLLTRRWRNGAGTMSWYSRNYTRDSQTGWVTFSTDTAGLATGYRYDSLGRVTQVSPPSEAVTTISYMNSPTVQQTTATRNGGTGLSTTQTYDYDGLGRMIRERRLMADGTYAKRFTKYDTRGSAYFSSEWVADSTSETISAGLQTFCGSFSTYRPASAPGTYRLCYDPFGRSGQVLGSMFSSEDLVDRTDAGLGPTIPYSDTFETTTTRCVGGSLQVDLYEQACGPGGVNAATSSRKDAFGRVTWVMEPGGDVTSYGYDVNSRLISVVQGGQTRTFSYDLAGFLRQETTPEKGTVTYDSYGSLGNLIQKTEGGVVSSIAYDAAGRAGCQIDGAWAPGADLSTVCSSGVYPFYSKNSYDGAGFAGGTYPGGRLTQRIGYNPGKPSAVTEQFTYSDPTGRLSSKNLLVDTTPQGTINVSESWTYNLLGLIASHTHPYRAGTDAAVTSTYTFSSGMPTGLTAGGQNRVSGVAYSPAAAVTSWTAGNGMTTTTSLDASGIIPRPSRIYSSVSGFDTGQYSYDGAGNILAMGSDTFGYDNRSRLTSSTVSSIPLSYSYDRYGNLNPSGVDAATNHLTSGLYDTRGNLVAAGSQGFAYDTLSRQTAASGGTSPATGVPERYLYDGAGERIARVNGGGQIYIITPCRVLDTRSTPPVGPIPGGGSRVVQVTGACGVPAGAVGIAGNLTVTNTSGQGFLILSAAETSPSTSTIDYDPGMTRANNFEIVLSPAGQVRIAAVGGGTDAILDVTGYFISPASVETWNLTFRDEANRLSSEYTVGTSISRTKDYFYFGNLLVSTRDGSGNYSYYSSDHLGTPRLASGALSETHKYQPFGQEITSPFGNQPLKLATMERDVSSGIDYDHARYTSPIQGRFLSPDKLQGKILDPQSWNRYAYARNSPLKFVDPNGLEVRYADKQLQGLYTRLAVRYSAVHETLGRYTGAGKPDLVIQRGDAGSDPRTGEKATGLTRATKITESYQGNWDKITSTKDTLPDTGKYVTEAVLKETTITIDSSLNPNSREQANAAVHEAGHADSLARDSVSYLQRGANDMETDPNTGKPLSHDDRPLEREANEYRDRACGRNTNCQPQ